MIRIAIQKSGRLTEQSLKLLEDCGMSFNWSKDRLMLQVTNFPLEILLVRDDDIPEYVRKGICDLGVVGENVLREHNGQDKSMVEIILRLGFGKCRLSLAVPESSSLRSVNDLQGKRIATSYPESLKSYLGGLDIESEIIEISGSVEIAPTLGVADAICDLVSTGSTLRTNGLQEIECLYQSESVIVQSSKPLNEEKQSLVDRLLRRINGVMRASCNKYIMMNAPRSALAVIRDILPGMEEPSVLPFACSSDRVAIHTVCDENVFWETMERLKAAGASSILVMPIEKILS
ncbi:MAG: ATP phosphoribosyltransferase [Bdellovibrionales bacterium]|nr:ATP phosphoribosyltransferase [Bdellovibrionales bacterium]